MAKSKLTLTASPTFKATVNIPVPGNGTSPVEFVFKGMKKDEFKDFVKAMQDKDDLDTLAEIASGWDLAEPFSKENLEKMEQSYIGSARAILDKYMQELTAARLGN